MKVISTKKAPAAIGPYSQAIQVGNLVYTSGQIPIDPATGVFVEGGIKEHTRQSLTNVKAILEEIGLTVRPDGSRCLLCTNHFHIANFLLNYPKSGYKISNYSAIITISTVSFK